MNDDSTPKLFITLTIPEEWMRRVNETAGEGAKIELVANFDVGGRNAHFTVKMTQHERQVFSMLGGNFFDYDTLETGRVLVTMPKKNVAHSDGGMP